MTLGECWRLAEALVISDHAVERYFLRSHARPACTAAQVEELVRAEFVRSWGSRRHQQLLEGDAHPRLAVVWKSESLVSLIRPASVEDRPVVLTILTFAMYDSSCLAGRYRRAA